MIKLLFFEQKWVLKRPSIFQLKFNVKTNDCCCTISVSFNSTTKQSFYELGWLYKNMNNKYCLTSRKLDLSESLSLGVFSFFLSFLTGFPSLISSQPVFVSADEKKNRKKKTEEKCRKEFYDFRILGPFFGRTKNKENIEN